MKPFHTAEDLAEAVRSPLYSHTRSRKWCGVWMSYVYHHDPASPSGFSLVAGDIEEAVSMVLIACGKPSSLSPTEPR